MTTNTSLVTRGSGPLTLWNATDVQFVKDSVAAKATDQDFRMMIHLANRWQLDPLSHEIYCIKYGSRPAQIFAGLAGLLKIGNATGLLDGLHVDITRVEEPFSVECKDGEQVRLYERSAQYVARATIYKKGCAHPFVMEAWEGEYSTGRDLWATKRQTMIRKVALCQALRAAFSISDLYDPSEKAMEQPDVVEGTAREIPNAAAPEAPERKAARKELATLLGMAGYRKEEMPGWIAEQSGGRDTAALTLANLTHLITLADQEVRRLNTDNDPPPTVPARTWDQPRAEEGTV